VHDELLFEVKESYVQAAAALVRGVMEDASAVWGLRVALPVKVSVGPSWGQLQEYTEA
jgi:DNA polymerase theta